LKYGWVDDYRTAVSAHPVTIDLQTVGQTTFLGQKLDMIVQGVVAFSINPGRPQPGSASVAGSAMSLAPRGVR